MMRKMDFLVRVGFARAYELPEDERAALLERERSRGRELLSQGVIRQLWRLPGTRTNIGIWSAADADALEEALASLPIRPYTEIEVTALAPYTP
jgi:muconolactone D-isomerase